MALDKRSTSSTSNTIRIRATSRLTTTRRDKDHLYFRYSKGNQYDPLTNSVALLGNTVNEAYLQSGAVNWNHTFSPNLLNEARFGMNYVKLPHGLTTFNPAVGDLGNTIGIANGNPAGVDGLPQFGFAGGSITNIQHGDADQSGRRKRYWKSFPPP